MAPAVARNGTAPVRTGSCRCYFGFIPVVIGLAVKSGKITRMLTHTGNALHVYGRAYNATTIVWSGRRRVRDVFARFDPLMMATRERTHRGDGHKSGLRFATISSASARAGKLHIRLYTFICISLCPDDDDDDACLPLLMMRAASGPRLSAATVRRLRETNTKKVLRPGKTSKNNNVRCPR